MARWLLNRLFDEGDQPETRFAFQGTINWMRALAILVENGSFEDAKIKDHYKSVQRRNANSEADTLVFENMVMAYHNQVCLTNLAKNVQHPYDVSRSAIINWYYSTYFTCKAMIAATSGLKQEQHAKTAKVWQRDIVSLGLVMSPFSLNLDSLVEKVIKPQITAYRNGNINDVNTYPENDEQAWGAVVSYLSGSWRYEKWRREEELKHNSAFKKLGVANFRTKAAREQRDNFLDKHCVNYLVQSFRYRGKANYRDSIFLSYGDDNSEKMQVFIRDLEVVSRAFQRMAAHYLSRRIEKGYWTTFIDDLEENSRLSINPQYLAV